MPRPADWIYEFLVCPCGHGRIDRADEGLHCTSCGVIGSDQDGIPRFVEQQHLASFGRQWNRYDVVRDDEDRRVFAVKTGVAPEDLAGMKVLDAGCGGGRYSRLAAQAGATVVGADQSTAVEKAADVCRGLAGAAFVQADLKRLPFEEGTFDFVFSIGVMHHDQDTRSVFDAVARMVRPGGRLVVWLYRRNQWWQEAINNRLRRRTVQMEPEQLERWCRKFVWLGGIPLFNCTLNKLVNFSNHPDRELRACDTYDWYAPRFQHHHRLSELRHWFTEAGFEDPQVLSPERTGWFYRSVYGMNLIIGSGINLLARKTTG